MLTALDAAAFLRQIQQHAAAGFVDDADRAAQLFAAVAAQAAEQIAGEAFRMQARQHRLRRIRRADHQRKMLPWPSAGRNAKSWAFSASATGSRARLTGCSVSAAAVS